MAVLVFGLTLYQNSSYKEESDIELKSLLVLNEVNAEDGSGSKTCSTFIGMGNQTLYYCNSTNCPKVTNAKSLSTSTC